MKVKNIVIAILVIALGGMIVYRITKNKAEKGKDKNDKKPPIGVSAFVVKGQDFSNTISQTAVWFLGDSSKVELITSLLPGLKIFFISVTSSGRSSTKSTIKKTSG